MNYRDIQQKMYGPNGMFPIPDKEQSQKSAIVQRMLARSLGGDHQCA
jgi:hypothetical protein